MKTVTAIVPALAIVFALQTGVAEARTNPLRAGYQKVSQRVKGWAGKLKAQPKIMQVKAKVHARWTGAKASVSKSLAKVKSKVLSTRRNLNFRDINHDNRPQYESNPATYIYVEMATHKGTRGGNYYKQVGETQSQFENRVYSEVNQAARQIAAQDPGRGYAKVKDWRQTSY
jgi:hypothetical protein